MRIESSTTTRIYTGDFLTGVGGYSVTNVAALSFLRGVELLFFQQLAAHEAQQICATTARSHLTVAQVEKSARWSASILASNNS